MADDFASHLADTIVTQLVAKFRADKASADEAARDVEAFTKRIESIHKAADSAQVSGLRSAQETYKAAYLKSLDELETSIRAFWQKKIREHMFNLGAIRKAHEDLNYDLANISKKREAALNPPAAPPSDSGGGGGLAGFAAGLGPILGTVGIPLLVGATIAGTLNNIAKELQAAYVRISAMNRIGFSLEAGAGQYGTGYGLIVSQGLRTLGNTLGMNPEDLARTASQFSNLVGEPGETGASRTVALTGQAVGLASRYGMSQSSVADVMGMYRRLEETPVDQLKDRFNDLAKAAAAASRPLSAFAKDVVDLTAMNREYGGNIAESAQLVGLFSKELTQGTISLQQLSQLQYGVARAPEGTRAFMAGEMVRRGLVHGDVAKRLSGLSASSAEFELRRMVEDKDDPGHYEARKGAALLAEVYGKRIAAGAPAGERAIQEEKWRNYFLEKFGLMTDGSIKSHQELFEAAVGMKEASKGMALSSKATENANEAIVQGMQTILNTLTFGARIQGLKNIMFEEAIDSIDEVAHPGAYKPGQQGYSRKLGTRISALLGAETIMGSMGQSHEEKVLRFQTMNDLMRMWANDPKLFNEAIEKSGSHETWARTVFKDLGTVSRTYQDLLRDARDQTNARYVFPYIVNVTTPDSSATQLNLIPKPAATPRGHMKYLYGVLPMGKR